MRNVQSLSFLEKFDAWSKYQLDHTDYKIFLLLQQNPSLSKFEISKELDLNNNSVSRRIEILKEKGFFRKLATISDNILGEREVSESEAIYSPTDIGLFRYHVILQNILGEEALTILDAFSNIHNYVHYSSFVYGSGINMYLQFDCPPEVIPLIDELLGKLQSKRLFVDYRSFNSYSVARTQVNPFVFNIQKNQWNYLAKIDKSNNLLRHSSQLQFLWKLFLDGEKVFEEIKPYETKPNKKFDKLDAYILRELTINAHIPPKRLAEIYKKESPMIYKRLQKIKSTYISDFNLIFDRSTFDLTYSQIITGSFHPNSEFNKKSFAAFLNSGKIPFQTTCILGDTQFLWYILCPPSIAPEFTRFVHINAKDVSIYQDHMVNSRTSFFNPLNLKEKGAWETSREYVVDDPLLMIDSITST